jgi:hypothetical protein
MIGTQAIALTVTPQGAAGDRLGAERPKSLILRGFHPSMSASAGVRKATG